MTVPEAPRRRLGVFLAERLHAGGGYQQSLNAAVLAAKQRLPGWSVKFFTLHRETQRVLTGLGLSTVRMPIGFSARCALVLRRQIRWPGLLRRVRRLIGANAFEKVFEVHGIDLVYFTSPTEMVQHLERINYLVTVWDLCHRDEVEFPEVRADREFEQRERYFREVLPKAVAVFADSGLGVQNLVRRYAIDPQRVHVMRSSPSQQVRNADDTHEAVEIRQLYGIDGEYVFYPAQFWAHKNHVYILHALQRLHLQHGIRLHAIFAGGDAGGTLAHVRAVAQRLGLESHIHFAGFVPEQTMPHLYRQALALVMPTYFGPTNLPPLEALRLGTPVLYPRALAAASGLEEVVRSIDLDDPQTLADELLALLAERTEPSRRAVNAKVNGVLQRLDDDEARLETLESVLAGFDRKRACWI
jgi:glycosyltransferase involved in cell wall biosynthesis